MSESNSSNKFTPILISIIGISIITLFIYFFIIPASAEIIAQHFSPGVGFKSAALISFFVSIATIILFAFAGGDGLLGEVQYMFGALFGLFFIIWIFIAWIF